MKHKQLREYFEDGELIITRHEYSEDADSVRDIKEMIQRQVNDHHLQFILGQSCFSPQVQVEKNHIQYKNRNKEVWIGEHKTNFNKGKSIRIFYINK